MDIIRIIDNPKVDKDFISGKLEKCTNMNINLKKFLLKDELYDPSIRSRTISELMELVKKNVWLEYFLKKKDNENKGWIDFESEISKIIQAYDYMKGYNNYKLRFPNKDYDKNNAIMESNSIKFIRIYNRIFNNINNENIDVFKLHDAELYKFIAHLNENMYGLVRCLEIYLVECVEAVKIKCNLRVLDEIKVNKVLSFNYTNTYKRIYGANQNTDEYDYIHGNVDISRRSDQSNMVLGIDEYLGKDCKDKDCDFIMFKKYFQRIYKKTGNTYEKWIEKVKKSKFILPCISSERVYKNQYYSNLYIIGHSLDVTDKDIFNKLILTEKMITTVFYHDNETHASLIANMVKIIGQDELIKRVHGVHPTIKFSKLY